jgi:uncharacterized Zn finger protein
MAKNNKQLSTPAASGWRDLSWDDLEAWAGPSSLRKGRQYQRSGRVRDLARDDNGSLLAWVQGTVRYATEVELRDKPVDGTRLFARCTCPLQISGCKHAVAVVVQYLEALKSGETLPAVDPSDERLELLDEPQPAPMDFDDERYEDESYDADADEEPVSRRRGRSRRETDLRPFLEGWSADELVSYVLGLADQYPEVRRELTTRANLERGDAAELIAQTKQEIRRVTSEQSWYNHWQHEGHLPSYTGVRQRLQRLLDMGQADALLSLGETLFQAGVRQVESSDDEGHTASELASCMEVVFQAVAKSSLPDARKLLFVIDRILEDPFDLCSGADAVLDAEWPAASWSEAADELLRRLHAPPAKSADDYVRNYARKRLSDWVIDCLRHAGREAEVLPLCEAEAPITHSYERLVRELRAAKRYDDAKRWAREGMEKTMRQWPGIAANLQKSLEEIAASEKDWPTVITLRREEFVKYPSVHTLDELLKAAKKTHSEDAVRAAALHFLETGQFPEATAPTVPARARSRGKKPKAPAPPSDARPHFDVLLDLALVEKRPDDVLRWYDRLSADRHYGYWAHRGAQVAVAVAATHPDRALELYRSIIERDVARTSPSAYEDALPYLRKVRALLHKQNRDAEWTAYLAGLREQHRRKRRFLEVLDRLENRRIVDG